MGPALRSRYPALSVGVQAPSAPRHPAKPLKHTHPHHDPRPLSEEILSAPGRGIFSKTVMVPRKGALSQSYTGTPPPGRRNHPTPTCHPSHSSSHRSKPLTLKVVLANARSDCIPSVSVGRKYLFPAGPWERPGIRI